MFCLRKIKIAGKQKKRKEFDEWFKIGDERIAISLVELLKHQLP
jgi:hypothetical protein